MKTLSVETKENQYPIIITQESLAKLVSAIAPYLTHQVAIITNTTVSPLYQSEIESLLTELGIQYFSIILPDGEKYKNWETLNLIYDGLLRNRAERQTTLLALGGGVIGDMVGFAAATYQRGVPFIQIPTTLLSQVDSSVGGKTAINHPQGKNMIGAFYQPQAVLTSVDTLKTLPDKELSAGLAEIIKIALVWDIHFFEWLENNVAALLAKEPEILIQAIDRSCAIKAEIVSQDEKEHGVRALLNLGHTFGHAIETEEGYGNWLHGEAVSAGVILACKLSQHKGMISEGDVQRVTNLLQKADLPVASPSYPLGLWLSHMSHDKKVENGSIRFILLEALGKGVVVQNVDKNELEVILK